MTMTRRDAVNFGMAAALMSQLGAVVSHAAVKPSAAERDRILAAVTPELRPYARDLLDGKGYPPVDASNLAIGRRIPPPSIAHLKVSVTKRSIPGHAGQPDVAIYILNARAGRRRPALLHTHGGGFILGTAQGGLEQLEKLCLALDCPAVSVDYRLAPETTYAGSIEDNYAGLKWLYHNADAIGADPARIALVGESAGGGHAALLAITARDRGEVPVAYQCLTYPMLDDRTASSRAVPSHIGQLGWTAHSNRFGWASFLGRQPGGPSVPAVAVPARVKDLKGLPPAFIGVGTIDLFFDEDMDYGRRLADAGVMVEMSVLPGAFHGFDVMVPESRIAQQFDAAKIAALKRGLQLAG